MIDLKRLKIKPNFNTFIFRADRKLALNNFDALKITTNKIFLIIFLALIAIILFLFYRIISTETSNFTGTFVDTRSGVPAAKASQTINKKFSFPLKDQEGKEVSKIKIDLQGVELRDQIIVKAQRVTAISGRTFLVLNLKITNEYNKTVQMNTRDYFRLSVNNNEDELLAPEIHNDPVEAQASSIKYTRLAFAINDSDKNLKLRVGELLNDKKTVIDLKL